MNRREFRTSVRVEIVKRACARRPDGQPACERCGAIGCKLEVHHKDMDAMQIDKSRKLTAEDGELLCEPCHDPITAVQRKDLARAQAREAKSLGATRSKQSIKSAGFKPVDRPHAERGVANGLSGIARRYGVGQ